MVLARAPRPGICKRRLEPLLGTQGCAALQALLIRNAARWAAEVAPGHAHLCVAPAELSDAVQVLGLEGVTIHRQGVGEMGRRVLESLRTALPAHQGPVLVAGVDVPALRADHARAALDDLDQGCQLTFGPATDGSPYLLGLARPDLPWLDEALGEDAGGELLRRAFESVAGQGLEVALLRSERELHAPADVRALLADPLVSPELRAALTPRP